MSNEKVKIEILKSPTGFCIAINDYRVAGSKPSPILNNIVQTFIVDKSNITYALELVKGVSS